MTEQKQEKQGEQPTTQPFPPGTEPPVTQSNSTEPGWRNDRAAQEKVQEALDMRVAHDKSIPFVPPEIPPGLSPNDIVTLAKAGAIEIPPQTDEPPTEGSGQAQSSGKSSGGKKAQEPQSSHGRSEQQ